MRFAKGHGTGNDFVILPDPDGRARAARLSWLRGSATGISGIGATACCGWCGLRPPGRMRGGQRAPVVHGLPQRRRQHRGDVRQRHPGVRQVPDRARDWPTGPSWRWQPGPGPGRSASSRTGSSPWTWGLPPVLGEGEAQAGGQQLAGLAISVGNPHLACMVDQPVAAIDLSGPAVLRPAELAAERTSRSCA